MSSKHFTYLTHSQIRTHVRKLKRVNKEATVLGLDVGRKYTGVSITDKLITTSKPLKTLVGSPNYDSSPRKKGAVPGTIDLSHSDGLFAEIRRLLMRRQVKAIVVGYPIGKNGRPTPHCNFIERWVEHMWSLGIGKRVPVTLVNEYGSSMEAKVLIAESIQRKALGASSDPQLRKLNTYRQNVEAMEGALSNKNKNLT
mmetsp:Transcript_19753/g.30476  ORF Transcript_19753/g.30476 Transcript_19753/m.30476 type:complete len:198 (-) Transcript_19753:225-818(-)